MSNLPLGPLPDNVQVSLGELAAVVTELERIMNELSGRGQAAEVDRIDAVVARMTRWVWSWLGRPDEEA